jgi:hypothetical protein
MMRNAYLWTPDSACLDALSRIFSSGVIRELARKGRSSLFARLTRQSNLHEALSENASVRDVFDSAFTLLKRQGYRHEYIYKAALTHRILLGKHSLQTASMLNEFRVGTCKADLAILNGTSTVYEVKSERDSLVRLQRQITAYRTVFSRVYVIAAEEHVKSVEASVPSDVGILVLTNRYQISTMRESIDQPERTSPAAIFDAIRTAEARIILEARGVSIPRVPNTVLNSVLRALFLELKPAEAHESMVHTLRKTRNLLPLSALVAKLPRSLHTAALSVPLRKSDHNRLVSAINTDLAEAMNWM